MKSLCVTLFGSFAGVALAQAPPDLDARLRAVEAAAKSAQSAGDNAWMLVSAALVLMMTGPGLALFYGGLVRRKNVLGTMMHSFVLMAAGHGAVGVLRLQPGLRRGQRFHRRRRSTRSSTAWGRLPIRITRPPSRS